jgi:tyrosyl-tRNA synthetase
LTNVMTTLSERGFVSQVSDPALADMLEKTITVYAGFDPTAESLHIGNLLQIMLLSQFQRHGHRPIALVGGATAMIGDPSGKSQERNLLDEQTIRRNQEGIAKQLRQFLTFDGGPNAAVLVNNADWIGRFSFIDFLRDVGKYFRVGEMMAKESVRKRLDSEAGMSFTEFSYQMLQAYDFVHLSRELGCVLQVGGDDQWGNITAGIDLARRLDGKQLYGLTSPLITTASGQKFGKTEAGTVWLDAARTSPYEFYQFWIRCDDRDVVRLLKNFTFLPQERIAELETAVREKPEQRIAQTALAEEVTRLVHGEDNLAKAKRASSVLFGQTVEGLSDADLARIFADVPSTALSRQTLADGLELVEVLCQTKMINSRGEAKKMIKAGGVYVNNIRINDLDHKLTTAALASESMAVLRTGKKNYHLLRFS